MEVGVCMTNDKKPVVLLTNDDGYQAVGLRALAEQLRSLRRKHRGTELGTQRGGAVVDAAAAHRLPQDSREGMGH